MTALRGLSAWLAAHSREARRHLIAADPVGVGLYGDIGGFSREERRRLLEALPRSLVHDDAYRGDTALAFRSLASADLVPVIQEMLGRVRTGSGNDAPAALGDRSGVRVTRRTGERIGLDRSAALILGVLRHSETPCAVAALAPDLMAIVRDDAVPSYLRTRALDACVRITADNGEQAEMLGGLLDASHLVRAQERQRVIHRDSSYHRPVHDRSGNLWLRHLSGAVVRERQGPDATSRQSPQNP